MNLPEMFYALTLVLREHCALMDMQLGLLMCTCVCVRVYKGLCMYVVEPCGILCSGTHLRCTVSMI